MHTPNPRTLTEDTQLFEAISLLLDEILPSPPQPRDVSKEMAAQSGDKSSQLQSWKQPDPDKAIYETFATDPGRSERFGGAVGVSNIETIDNITQTHEQHE